MTLSATKTSPAGVVLIETREGKRLVAYRDSRGIWTIGVGHTGRMSGAKVTPGMTITEEECRLMLAADLTPVESTIVRVLKVPVTQNEFDALASLGFNIGIGGLAKSEVVRKLNLGDIQGAADAFRNWEKPPELASRREGERTQFLRADPEAAVPHEVVAQARAVTLTKRAAAAQAKSEALAKAAGGIGVATTIGTVAASTVATHAASGHHALIAAAVIVGMGFVAAGVGLAVHFSKRAVTLVSGAASQGKAS